MNTLHKYVPALIVIIISLCCVQAIMACSSPPPPPPSCSGRCCYGCCSSCCGSCCGGSGCRCPGGGGSSLSSGSGHSSGGGGSPGSGPGQNSGGGGSGSGNSGSPTTGDPVFIKQGEFVYDATDLSIQGRRLKVEIERTYRSQRDTSGPFGYSWDFNYNMRLVRMFDEGKIKFSDGSGRSYEYYNEDYLNYLEWVKCMQHQGDCQSDCSNRCSNGGCDYDACYGDCLDAACGAHYSCCWVPWGCDGQPSDYYPYYPYYPCSKFTRSEMPWQYIIGDEQSDRFSLITPDLTYIFDSTDRLWKIEDKFNNTIVIDYNDTYPDRIDTITDDIGRKIYFTYNINGFIESISDFAGREWEYNYNGGDLAAVTGPNTVDHPDGLTTTYSYTNHNLVSITDPNDDVIVYNYYNAKDEVRQQDIDGASYVLYNETSTGVMTTTDREGYTIKQAYNKYGQLISRTVYTKNPDDEPNHFTTTYSYNSEQRRRSIVYPAGNCVYFTYDIYGNLIGEYWKTSLSEPNSRTDPDVLATTYTYDTTWTQKVKTETDPMGNVTTYDYGSTNGNLVKITYPQVATVSGNQSPTTEFTYDSSGRIETIKAADNIITKYVYYTNPSDPNYGRVWKVIEDYDGAGGLNLTTEYKYDVLGRVREIKDANGYVTKVAFNNLEQMEKTITPSPFSYVTRLSYDKNGNMSRIEREKTDANQITQFVYDRYKKLLRTTDPLNNATLYGYNKNDEPNIVTDAEGNKTKYEYNERGLVSKATDANGFVTEYRYNLNGELAEIEDANGNVTGYAYDSFDRLKCITYPDDTNEVFTYDKNSNILSKKNRRNETIGYQYNALSWTTAKSRPGEADITYEYDIAGRIKEVSQGTSSTVYNYDRVGRVSGVTDADSRTVACEYNNRGLRTKLTYPDSSYVNYEYDAMSRLSKVKYNGSIIAQYSYDELSRRTLLRRNDNADMNTVYQYDLGNRLTGLKNRFNAAQTQVIQYSEYDNVGNRKNMIVDNNEYSYTYDKLYQLVGVDYPAGFGTDTTYYYDKLGNRRKVEADTVTDYSSNNLNQYTAIGTTLPEYDASGNLTKYGSFRYFYDCENRLTDVNLNTVRKMHCQYDYLGRRVSKTVSSNTTKFCYDGDQIIAEYNGSGTLLRKYIYGPGIDEPICMINVNGGETKYYYHFDGLGSVVALSDSSGAVIESYRYNAFGQPSATSSIGNRFMFTGREYDTETGLYYYRARYYKPSIGRFLQTDPIVYIDSMNLYTYSLNNPVMLRDPSGMIGFRSWWGVSSRSECLSLAGRDRDERLNEARRLYNDALRLNDAGRDACHHGCDRAFPPGRCPGTDPGDANAGCKFLCDTAAGAVRTAAYAVYAATRTAIWTGYGIANATCRTLYP